MKHHSIYNTSDIGYMDEEWINYDPKKVIESKLNLDKLEIENKEVTNEEQIEEI